MFLNRLRIHVAHMLHRQQHMNQRTIKKEILHTGHVLYYKINKIYSGRVNIRKLLCPGNINNKMYCSEAAQRSFFFYNLYSWWSIKKAGKAPSE